jgi:serine/threonine protein kinase
MKTHFGRPDEPPVIVRSTGVVAGQTAAELFKRGRDTVLAHATRLGGPRASSAALPALTAEQHVLLRLVDGRLSVARLARLAGLSEDATAQAVSGLCAQNLLVVVEPTEVTIHGQSGSPFYKLGQYEIAARIGQGGMGSVYVCRKIGGAGFRRLFALKVVRQNSGQEDAACRAFVREMSVGRLLTHPNVQSVVDVGTYSDQPYLVLDWVEGTDLEELVSTGGGPMSPGVLLTVLADVLRGLQAAHELVNEDGTPLGLVHGDVSPPNILIGLDGVARLADFGNVRYSARGETGHNDAYVVGKPAFMAPEHFRGQPTDRRSDLFSVGVVMWNALTGRELFAAETYEDIVRNVLEKEIVPPSAFGAPPCLDEVCMRALSREPRWRYGTADELAEDLLRLAVQNGLRATPTQVSAYVRAQMGATVAETRQRIEQGFRGVRTDAAAAAVPAPVPSPDSVRIPALPRRRVEPTVVLPKRGSRSGAARATAVAASPRRPQQSEPKRLIWIGVFLSLGALGFFVAVLVSNHVNGSAQSRRSSMVPAGAAAAPRALPAASHSP